MKSGGIEGVTSKLGDSRNHGPQVAVHPPDCGRDQYGFPSRGYVLAWFSTPPYGAFPVHESTNAYISAGQDLIAYDSSDKSGGIEVHWRDPSVIDNIANALAGADHSPSVYFYDCELQMNQCPDGA